MTSPGVVRVIPVHIAGLEQSHPRGQLGLVIQHLLARGGQLPGEHPAKPGGALHRPRAFRPCRRPRQQLPGLVRAGANPLPAQRLIGRADRHRGVRPVVRADSDHHCQQHAPQSHQGTGQTAAGTPYTGPVLGARPSFEPRRGEVRRSRHIDLKPGTRAGRRFGSQPHRASRDVTANRSVQSDGLYLYKAGRRAVIRRSSCRWPLSAVPATTNGRSARVLARWDGAAAGGGAGNGAGSLAVAGAGGRERGRARAAVS